MIYVAWRMLVGDTTKYISLVLGLAFASLLIVQQSSIFVGIMARTYSTITDVTQARVWVLDEGVQYPDDLKPLKDPDLLRVRDVAGVDWAVPLFKGTGRARTRSGEFQTVMIIGLDSPSLIGAPREVLDGELTSLYEPDAVLVDDAGAARLGGVKRGDVLELNDHRARITGICRVGRTFNNFPVIYTTFNRARLFAPRERHMMSFVLAAPKPGITDEELAARIRRHTGLGALTTDGFARRTLDYYIRNTGIAINFGMTVLLGFLIGLAIAAQTFYTFTIENLRHWGALKAMGTSDRTIAGMVLLQAFSTGLLGYGIGVGGASIFGAVAGKNGQLAFQTPPLLLALSFVLVMVLVAFASLVSVRRVVKLEPAIVFRS
jgi:putative ABC transport system permease protein